MSHARTIYAKTLEHIHALGRILQAKEKLPDNVVKLPPPKPRTIEEVKHDFSRCAGELGARVAAMRGEQRIIDNLHAKMDALKDEGASIEAAKVPEATPEQMTP